MGPALTRLLLTYFRSGWAFLLPYLPPYLIYWWLKWPVNSIGAGMIRTTPVTCEVVPLLHIYWVIHAMNVLLGVIALIICFLNRRKLTALAGSSVCRESVFNVLRAVLPWTCLAMLFWIPGVYLEFPSDPWAHLGRINEWSVLDRIDEHSSWQKTTYFLSYSILGRTGFVGQQQVLLDVFYTACCLLLCWQYYRLARALRLGVSSSLAFVIILILTFGNNLFGFYRYYGISSTLFSQLAAIALVRIAIEIALAQRKPNGSELLAAGALLTLLAGSHIQGVGIAALELVAVGLYSIVRWRRAAVWWLGAGMIAISIAVVQLWTQHLAIKDSLIKTEWITPWYGFNILKPGSPACDRLMAILGTFGLVNLACGLLLLGRNHLIGWLTVIPVFALCLPAAAVPFVGLLVHENDIVTFHRMLFAIPSGLAVVCLSTKLITSLGSGNGQTGAINAGFTGFQSVGTYVLLLTALAIAMILPSSQSAYNRVFQMIVRSPDDLALRNIGLDANEIPRILHEPGELVTTANGAFIACALYNRQPARTWRTLHSSTNIATLIQPLTSDSIATWHVAIFVDPLAITSSASQVAWLSNHWHPYFVSTEYSGFKEATHLAEQSGSLKLHYRYTSVFTRAP